MLTTYSTQEYLRSSVMRARLFINWPSALISAIVEMSFSKFVQTASHIAHRTIGTCGPQNVLFAYFRCAW